jgi:hypothetical protein
MRAETRVRRVTSDRVVRTKPLAFAADAAICGHLWYLNAVWVGSRLVRGGRCAGGGRRQEVIRVSSRRGESRAGNEFFRVEAHSDCTC